MSHPGQATQKMLTTHNSVAHATSHLFFFTINSAESGLLV